MSVENAANLVEAARRRVCRDFAEEPCADGQLAHAATYYALQGHGGGSDDWWPFAIEKAEFVRDPLENYVRAAAFLHEEIDRLVSARRGASQPFGVTWRAHHPDPRVHQAAMQSDAEDPRR